jgi:hypothetical protein
MRVNLTTEDPYHRLSTVLHGKIITLPESINDEEVFLTTDEEDQGQRLIVSIDGVIRRVSPNTPVIIHGELAVET